MFNKFAVSVILLSFLLLSASALPFKKKVENFTLKDYSGKEHSLSDFKNSKAIVLIFVSTQCPVSNAYNSRMAELHKQYQDDGVIFLGINSNKAEDNNNIMAHARQNNLNFPILKDVDNKVADKLGASVTPEVYVLNGKLEILYHGRIDDSRSQEEVTSNDLSKALDEVLTGKQVSKNNTKAFGCTIKRV